MIEAAEEWLERLIGYHGRRWVATNGWAVEIQVRRVGRTAGRPWGVKYSLVLRDIDGQRIFGLDNAHGIPRKVEWDHRHGFRRTDRLLDYKFVDGDALIADFFRWVRKFAAEEGEELDFVGGEEVMDDPDRFQE